jgi:hypothetical protein
MATIKKAKTGTSVPKTNSVSKNIGNLNKAKNGKPVKKAFLGAALPIAMKALPMLGGMLGGKGKEGGMGGLGGMLGGLLGGKNGKTVKKSKNGSSLGMKSVKSGYDNNSGVTRADFVAIGKGKAKSGTKMKMGGSIKKAQTGTVQSANQQTQSNVNKIAMKNAGDSLQKSAAGAAKNGKSMKKCKYGCK